MNKFSAGKVIMTAGLFMTLSSLTLVMYNRNESARARNESEYMVSKIIAAENSELKESIEEFNISQDYQTDNIDNQYINEDGLAFIGILIIPELKIQLPVCSDFNMNNLSSFPCVYSNNISDKNIIIAAHNYDSHFGNIKSLGAGDKIILKTVSGKNIIYEVFSTDIIPGDKPSDMMSGEWDLTLFTCTKNGKDRIAVRCFDTTSESS